MIALYVASLLGGFILLVKGSDYFVDGAAGVAARFGISQLVIGLTIVAMGTSAPEAAVSLTAAFAGSSDITIGNIVGSNILNTFLILGIASVMVTIAVAGSTVSMEIPYMILCSFLLLLFGADGQISRVDGAILWGMFLLYLTYLFFNAKNNKQDTEEIRYVKGPKQFIYIFGGLAAILLGSKLAVYGAGGMARLIGCSERLIGLTIVALGTSLPELFTSVVAARKGNADIAIGNIVGSNIFNILFIVGTTALVAAVPYDRKFLVDSVVMTFSGILLLLCVVFRRKLTRSGGIIMLACYALYFGYLCLA